MRSLTETSEAFDAALVDGDEHRLNTLVEDALADGHTPLELLLDVVGPSPVRAGFCWWQGGATPAQEQAKTGLAQQIAGILDERIPDGSAPLGTVVVVCPERDWHPLPASLAAWTLRASGWRVHDLGASVPAAPLGRQLHDLGPDAVVVSCTAVAGLRSATAVIETARQGGVPVLAIGDAFGPDEQRALVLGANAWSNRYRDIPATIARLPVITEPVPSTQRETLRELDAIDQRQPILLDSALRRWAKLATDLDAPGWASLTEVARDIVAETLDALAGVLLTEDTRLAAETVRWQRELLIARGVDLAVLPVLGWAVEEHLDDLPITRDLLVAHWTAPE